MQYLGSGYYPVQAPPDLYITGKGKLSPSIFFEVKEKHKTQSLRNLGKEYGVSHETVRRSIDRKAVKQQSKTGNEPSG